MQKLIGMLLGLLAALATQIGVGAVMVLVLGLTAPSAAYAAPSFNFIIIDVAGDPGILTEAFGINVAGQIVGVAHVPTWMELTYDDDGLLWEAGAASLFAYDAPPGSISGGVCQVRCSETYFQGINDTGQIVGFSYIGQYGFLSDPANGLTIISVPGASRTEAYGINNAGQILGS